MKLATLEVNGAETAAVYTPDGLILLADINQSFSTDFPVTLQELIQTERLDKLNDFWNQKKDDMGALLPDCAIPPDRAVFAPPYRHPRKIWGIGLNYRAHAGDLGETAPSSEPASFMKPDTTIIGHGDTIHLPLMSERVTGEAELGLVFGKMCRDVDRSEWRSVLAGFTTIIDMTAEDILRRNPRNLTQAKSFNTFFSFGPLLYTIDECVDVMSLRIATVHNGGVHAGNTVANMTFPPDYLVSYHSRIMTMLPGDIISTGTPGAAVLRDGDVIECRIDGWLPLVNPVIDLKYVREA
ncbi:MAG: fumarylacetoacetate hydrolase family protein [candidate division Zixibacteria bacterium]|nr:fumarylacetoacetate hydrolase family protein [candidate division Zixibacteria bacterium]